MKGKKPYLPLASVWLILSSSPSYTYTCFDYQRVNGLNMADLMRMRIKLLSPIRALTGHRVIAIDSINREEKLHGRHYNKPINE